MNEVCGDNRFEIIKRARKAILDVTNINTSPDEMKVLDNILFRCWLMGWLDKYKDNADGIYMELFAMKDGVRHNVKIVNIREMSQILTNSLMDGLEKLWS